MSQTLTNRPSTEAAPNTGSARHGWPVMVLEFTLVLIFSLLALEPVLTLAGAADDQVQDVDAVTGWSPMVNRDFAWRGEWYCRDHFNSQGLRGPERSFIKPPHTSRIVVIGDSLTQGLQVPNEQTYCSALEEDLNAVSPKRKIEVLNLGVNGFFMAQDYWRLKSFGLKFSPDLVIIAARPELVGNKHIGFQMLGPSPELVLQPDGQFVWDHNQQTQWRNSFTGHFVTAARWFRYNSRIWGTIGICAEQFVMPMEKWKDFSEQLAGVAAILQAKFGPKHSAGTDQAQNQPMDHFVYSSKVFESILGQANQECQNQGARLMLVYLPDLRHKGDPRESTLLKECTNRLHIDYLDLNPAFKQIDKQPHGPLIFRAHFNKPGHRAVADQLAQFIEKEKLLP